MVGALSYFQLVDMLQRDMVGSVLSVEPDGLASFLCDYREDL